MRLCRCPKRIHSQVAGGSHGWQVAGRHSRVPGLGPQIPGSGVQHQVQVRVQARLFASHFCTFARGISAFAPLHFISRTQTRKPVPDTR